VSFDISTIPWELGQTANGGLPAPVDDKMAFNLEGMEYVIRDTSPNFPSGETYLLRRVRLVRNPLALGLTVLPGRLVVLDPAKNVRAILGYPTADAERAYPVDEFLPAGGVLPGDLFYVTTGGPAKVMLPAASPPTVAVGGQVVGALAAARTTATGGRIKLADYTAGATLPDNIRNAMTALQASSTANAQIYVQVPWNNIT
jgi:hypothetical protein